MYFPYSQRSTVLETFTSGDLTTNILGVLEGTGWTKTTDGIYTYLACTSPQGLNSRVKIWDGTYWWGTPVTYFQFGLSGQGATYAVWKTSRTYQIHANQCQFFLSSPGLCYDIRGSVVCGGIPFVPSTSELSEVFWSCGDAGGSPFNYGETFRRSLLNSSYDSRPSGLILRDAYYGSSYCAGNGSGSLKLETLTSPGEINYNPVAQLANAIYYDDTPIYIPGLLAWGLTNSDTHKIRGILWDACVGTGPDVMDRIVMIDANTWINFTDEQYFGSLYLLMPTAGSGNYAY